MSLKVQIDTTEFNRHIGLAIQYSSRAMHVVVNSQALAFAKRALDATKRASLDDIERLRSRAIIGVDAYTKRGKPRKRPRNVYSQRNTIAENIIISRYRKAGKKVPSKEQVRDEADRMVSARKKSVAFIASGWVPALRRLIQWDRERRGLPSAKSIQSRKGAAIVGSPKGYAKPAPSSNFRSQNALVVNMAIIPQNQWQKRAGDPGGDPGKYAKRGVNTAMVETQADIIKHVQEKLDKLDRTTSGLPRP